MSVDLLSLFNGNTANARPAGARTTPSSPAAGTVPDMGPSEAVITAGAYTIEVAPPSPVLTRQVNGSSVYYGGSIIDENKMVGPDGSGRYYFETAKNKGSSSGTPAPAPESPTPGSNKPAIFYAALAIGYTDAKTTAAAALNERLYKALTRSTK